MYWVERQNKLELPDDEEEVNTRDIHKCDGQAHDPDTMAAPLTPKPTRKAESLAKARRPHVCVSHTEDVFFLHPFFFFISSEMAKQDKQPLSPRNEPPMSPRGALPSPAADRPHNRPTPHSAECESKGGKREKRVRSATRKRGSRGQGGKQKHKAKEVARKQALAATRAGVSEVQSVAAPLPTNIHPNPVSNAIQSAMVPFQPVGMLPNGEPMTPQSPPKKRKRERKNRNWKPWSEQTWEERLERERYQERRAAAKEAQESLPLSKKKKKKARNEFAMPRAPRNTTQALMHADSSHQNGDAEPSSMPSMEGLLSRQAIANRQWAKDMNESSDSSDEEQRGHSSRSNGAAAERTPHRSPLSPRSSLGSPESELARIKAAAEADEKDRRIVQLEEHNLKCLPQYATIPPNFK
jgi:hypothetical protein